MTKQRPPRNWKFLYPGDQVGTRLPLHRINRHFKELEEEGYKFVAWPSESGYWVVCQQRPGEMK